MGDRDQSERLDPWEWMEPYDVARFGDVINDPAERTRWCRAILLGGLPYMWRRKAAAVREMIYDRLQLTHGDRVLILGECLEACGFVDDIRARIGNDGVIQVIDITEEARDAYFAGKVGAGGQIATWRFDYTRDSPDGYFDCVAVLQGVTHSDDWRHTGIELLRIMKSGRRIVLAEITFGPSMYNGIESDLHIEYVFEKISAGLNFGVDLPPPYYSPAQLLAAFEGLVDDADTFAWKGVELFWGTKP